MIELDEITIRRAANGQKAAFRKLYDWYAPYVWRIVFKMTGDKSAAEELVQETFINTYNSLKKFRSASSFSTWIYRITYNVVMAYITRCIKMKTHDSYEDTIRGAYRSDTYESQEIVNKIMSGLSADERFLLVAREVDNFSFDELSKIIGDTAGSLRTKLHRLKERIRISFPKETETKEAV